MTIMRFITDILSHRKRGAVSMRRAVLTMGLGAARF